MAKQLTGLKYLHAAAGQLLSEHSGVTGSATSPAVDSLAEAVARAYAAFHDGRA